MYLSDQSKENHLQILHTNSNTEHRLFSLMNLKFSTMNITKIMNIFLHCANFHTQRQTLFCKIATIEMQTF